MVRKKLLGAFLLAVWLGPVGLALATLAHELQHHEQHEQHEAAAECLAPEAQQGLAHGHWHDPEHGEVSDHEHPMVVAATAVAERTRGAAGPSGTHQIARLPGFALVLRVAPREPPPATESPPGRPAGTSLLHQISLLRI